MARNTHRSVNHRTNVISPAQLSANTDNWNPTGLATTDVIRVSTDASRNLTGIVAPAATWALILANIGAFDLVLKHDATSTAANRFYCPNDVDLTLAKDTTVALVYDMTSARWRVEGASLSSLGAAPSTADYLVGTAQAGLSAEIVVGTTPGGELGGTWASPTVDATHSGSAHHAPELIGSVTVSGTPAQGNIIVATSATTAQWAAAPWAAVRHWPMLTLSTIPES